MQAISIDFEILSRAEIRCSSRGCFVRVKMKQSNSRGLPAGGGGEIPGAGILHCLFVLIRSRSKKKIGR